MIRVRIIKGAALDVEDLLQPGKYAPVWAKIIGLWNRYVVDKFEIFADSSRNLELVEGSEYHGWPCGNGKVWLIDKVTEENQDLSLPDFTRTA